MNTYIVEKLKILSRYMLFQKQTYTMEGNRVQKLVNPIMQSSGCVSPSMNECNFDCITYTSISFSKGLPD